MITVLASATADFSVHETDIKKVVDKPKAHQTCDIALDNLSTSDVRISLDCPSVPSNHTSPLLYPNDGENGSFLYEDSYGIDVTVDVTTFVSGTTKFVVYEDGYGIGNVLDNVAITGVGSYPCHVNTTTAGGIFVVVY